MIFFIIALFLITEVALSDDTASSWKLIGPGDADMVSSLSVLTGDLFAGTDIGGLYMSSDLGESWKPINSGLKNYDISTPVIEDPWNPAILYVGTRGGFYKSVDRGKNWCPKWKGLSGPKEYSISAPIGAIAVSHVEKNVIYMAFGCRLDKNSSGKMISKALDGKFYKSIDGGESWKAISFVGDKCLVRCIAFSPWSDRSIYLATGAGMFISRDGGYSWIKILTGDSRYIFCNPEHENELYVVMGAEGIVESTNGGTTWRWINDGLPIGPGNNYDIITGAMDKEFCLYALNSTWSSGGGAYKLEGADQQWESITKWKGIGAMPESWLKSSRRVNAIAISPNDSLKIFLGTSRYIYRSDNGGKTWKQLISRKVNEGRWTHRGLNVFGGTPAVAVDPLNNRRIYVGTADHGLVISDDEGKSWFPSTKGMAFSSSIWDIKIDKKNPKNIYVINSKLNERYRVAKSDDYGKIWKENYHGLDEKNRLHCLLLDPMNSDIIYVGGQGGIYITQNGGKSWYRFGKGYPDNLEVRFMVRNHLRNNEIYAATNNGLYKSEDNGYSWQKISKRQMNCYSVMLDVTDAKIIYIGTRQTQKSPGGLFKSIDAGKNWEKILDARWVSSIIKIPFSEIIYATTHDHNYHDESSGSGIFRSANKGKSWDKVNEGLPVLRAFDMALSPSQFYKVYIGTSGSGVFVREDPVNMSNKY